MLRAAVVVSEYRPRHAKRPEPAELPPILRGVADLIEVLSDEE